MSLIAQLNRTLNLGPNFLLCEDEDPGYIFTNDEWMSAEPDLVSKVALSNQPEEIAGALHHIAKEIGDESVIATLKTNPAFVISKARPEAIRIMPEIMEEHGFTPEFLAKNLNKKIFIPVPEAQLPKKYKITDKDGIYQGTFNTKGEAQAALKKLDEPGVVIPATSKNFKEKYGLVDENDIVREGPYSEDQATARLEELGDSGLRISAIRRTHLLPRWIRRVKPEKFAFWSPEEIKRYFDEWSRQYDKNAKLYNYAIYDENGNIQELGPMSNGTFKTKREAEEALSQMDNPEQYTVGAIRKKWYGDQVFGIYNVNKEPPELVPAGPIHGRFESSAHAEKELYSNDDLFEDPDDFMVMSEVNPRSTGAILHTYMPMSDTDPITGASRIPWTKEEVYQAMLPIIKSRAYKYASTKLPFEDMVQYGAIGLLDALDKDTGESPFGAYAARLISRHMRDAMITGGTIKGARDVPEKLKRAAGATEKGVGGYGEGGVAVGYQALGFSPDMKHRVKETYSTEKEALERMAELKKEHPNWIFPVEKGKLKARALGGGLASINRPAGTGDDGDTEWSQFLRATKTKNPSYIAQQRDAVRDLLLKAKYPQKSKGGTPLSPEQEAAIKLMFGLESPEEPFHAPESEPEEGEGGYAPQQEREKGEGGRIKHGWEPTASREPGQQYGRKNVKVSKDTHTVPGIGDISVVRNAAEVAQALGRDPKTTREKINKGLLKLMKTAVDASRSASKKIQAGTATKEEIEQAHKILLAEDLIRNILFERLITGQLLID